MFVEFNVFQTFFSGSFTCFKVKSTVAIKSRLNQRAETSGAVGFQNDYMCEGYFLIPDSVHGADFKSISCGRLPVFWRGLADFWFDNRDDSKCNCDFIVINAPVFVLNQSSSSMDRFLSLGKSKSLKLTSKTLNLSHFNSTRYILLPFKGRISITLINIQTTFPPGQDLDKK